VILDIGANQGQTVDAYRAILPQSVIHCFEPFPEAFSALQDRFKATPATYLHNLAVSDATGDAEFFVTANSLLNSLLPILPDERTFKTGAKNLERLRVPTITLDEFALTLRIERLDVLKLDIQGAEMKALRGAHGLLAAHRIGIVFLEVCFAPMYDGQSTFPEIVKFLDDNHYRLYGLYDMAREQSGMLGWCNAIFVNPQTYDALSRDFWS
jgi:FkbM family methyltransferase